MGTRTAQAIASLLRNHGVNWDSYGAPRVSQAACAHAEGLVATLEGVLGPQFQEPIVGPDVGGGVELCWESPNGTTEVHVYVPPSGASKVVVLRDQKLERSFVLNSPAEVLTILTRSHAAAQ